MEFGVFTINPYSLFDVVAFAFAASLAVAFYAIYWKVTRRLVDLAFAHVLAFTALAACATLMIDNALAPYPALLWQRVFYMIGAMSLPLMIHFVYAFVGHRPRAAKPVIAGLCVLAGVLMILTTSPWFLTPPVRERGPVSWRNVTPYLPDPGPLVAVFFLVWLVVSRTPSSHSGAIGRAFRRQRDRRFVIRGSSSPAFPR